MTHSPLSTEPLFHLGMVPISAPVAVTWGIIAACWAASILIVCGFAPPSASAPISKWQAAMELFADAIDRQIRDTMQVEPGRYRALIGALFLYILAANWSALIPGVEPPTAHIETDAALALIVLCATVYFGIRERGLKAYLGTFAEPNWVMIPLNLVEQITRSFSLVVRLFGNVMSGVFIVGIVNRSPAAFPWWCGCSAMS
jgi:F-type H+-transporting ATPase subunit a